MKKTAYLVGIKGVAMTSLAIFLSEKGFEVTGSDVTDIFPTDKILAKHKIKVKEGFSETNIDKNYSVAVVTGAHGGMTNIESVQAKKLGIPTYMHGEFLGREMEGKFGISIAGCHGKTTTSSITAFLLDKSGLGPSYAIGTAEINGLGAAGHFGHGKFFIAEADEYMTCPKTDSTPRMLWQNPKILVITSIDYDHPDAFADIDDVKNAYLSFTEKLKEDAIVIVCIDDINVASILAQIKRQVITYGFSPRADFQIDRFSAEEGISFMSIKHKNITLGNFMLSIAGKHNMTNAAAAIIVGEQLGIGRDIIKKNIRLYTGCKRRFEKIANVGNVILYDDYAHHPAEIQATLSAVKLWYPKRRIIAIFQPHTFSRTKVLLSDFAKSFSYADLALICDIYPSAREKPDSSINSNMLSLAANKYKRNAYYLAGKKQILSFLDKNLKEKDLIITMGAGNIYMWHDDIKKLLRGKYTRL